MFLILSFTVFSVMQFILGVFSANVNWWFMFLSIAMYDFNYVVFLFIVFRLKYMVIYMDA